MEETLGKRIAACRKALGLTQEALAEQLGVTAQAVSKWENDLSCPDITMLPKLSEVFGVTTDELLGIKKETVHSAEVVIQEEEEQAHGPNVKGDFELQFKTGRRVKAGLALWLIFTGAVLLYGQYRFPGGFTLWDALWPSGLLAWGLFGLFPEFSILRAGLGLYGGYTLASLFLPMPRLTDSTASIALALVLLGLFLLFRAIFKPGKGLVHIHHNGPVPGASNHFEVREDAFDCGLSFGETTHLIELSRLSFGEASLSFGELTLDLKGCQEIADGSHLALNAAFGELTLLVPKQYKVEQRVKSAFGVVSVDGSPDQDAKAVIYVDGKVSFGHLQVKYI